MSKLFETNIKTLIANNNAATPTLYQPNGTSAVDALNQLLGKPQILAEIINPTMLGSYNRGPLSQSFYNLPIRFYSQEGPGGALSQVVPKQNPDGSVTAIEIAIYNVSHTDATTLASRIAHELAHLLGGLPPAPVKIKGQPATQQDFEKNISAKTIDESIAIFYELFAKRELGDFSMTKYDASYTSFLGHGLEIRHDYPVSYIWPTLYKVTGANGIVFVGNNTNSETRSKSSYTIPNGPTVIPDPSNFQSILDWTNYRSGYTDAFIQRYKDVHPTFRAAPFQLNSVPFSNINNQNGNPIPPPQIIREDLDNLTNGTDHPSGAPTVSTAIVGNIIGLGATSFSRVTPSTTGFSFINEKGQVEEFSISSSVTNASGEIAPVSSQAIFLDGYGYLVGTSLTGKPTVVGTRFDQQGTFNFQNLSDLAGFISVDTAISFADGTYRTLRELGVISVSMNDNTGLWSVQMNDSYGNAIVQASSLNGFTEGHLGVGAVALNFTDFMVPGFSSLDASSNMLNAPIRLSNGSTVSLTNLGVDHIDTITSSGAWVTFTDGSTAHFGSVGELFSARLPLIRTGSNDTGQFNFPRLLNSDGNVDLDATIFLADGTEATLRGLGVEDVLPNAVAGEPPWAVIFSSQPNTKVANLNELLQLQGRSGVALNFTDLAGTTGVIHEYDAAMTTRIVLADGSSISLADLGATYVKILDAKSGRAEIWFRDGSVGTFNTVGAALTGRMGTGLAGAGGLSFVALDANQSGAINGTDVSFYNQPIKLANGETTTLGALNILNAVPQPNGNWRVTFLDGTFVTVKSLNELLNNRVNTGLIGSEMLNFSAFAPGNTAGRDIYSPILLNNGQTTSLAQLNVQGFVQIGNSWRVTFNDGKTYSFSSLDEMMRSLAGVPGNGLAGSGGLAGSAGKKNFADFDNNGNGVISGADDLSFYNTPITLANGKTITLAELNIANAVKIGEQWKVTYLDGTSQTFDSLDDAVKNQTGTAIASAGDATGLVGMRDFEADRSSYKATAAANTLPLPSRIAMPPFGGWWEKPVATLPDGSQQLATINSTLFNDIGQGYLSTLFALDQQRSGVYHAVQSSVAMADGVPGWALYDPVIIDFNNDGFDITAPVDGVFTDASGKAFNYLSGAILTPTSWVASGSDDGVLFFDTQSTSGEFDTTLHSVGQLFGFDRLGDFDTNDDGIFSADDNYFDHMRVSFADGSVKSLQELGIESISVDTTSTDITDLNGNHQKAVGTVTFADQSTTQAADYDLQFDRVNTRPQNILDETEAVAALPDIEGSGFVLSLHQKMLTDQTGILQDLVQAWVDAPPVFASRSGLLDEIILKWTGAHSPPSSTGFGGNFGSPIGEPHVSDLAPYILDAFLGRPPATGPVAFLSSFPLQEAGEIIKDMVFGQLSIQTQIADLADKIVVNSYSDGSTQLDFSAVATALLEEIDVDALRGKYRLAEFVRSVRGLGWIEISNYQSFYNTFAELGTDFTWLMDTAGYSQNAAGDGDITKTVRPGSSFLDGNTSVALRGGTGNQELSAFGSRTVIYGGVGDTVIQGMFAMQDRFVCGQGNTTINCGVGAETIVYNEGSGNATIVETYRRELHNLALVGDHTDTLEFGLGIDTDEVIFSPDGLDLVIKFTNSDGTITIKDELKPDNEWDKKVTSFNFSDSTRISLAQVISFGLSLDIPDGVSTFVAPNFNLTITANDDDSTIFTGDGDDIVYAGSGNQTIVTGIGSDVVVLGAGNDTVHLGDGFQTVIFGTGNATVDGGSISNTYQFSLDSGNANIARAGGFDSISFGNDIAANDLSISYNSSDLIISVDGAVGQIILQGQLADGAGSGELSFQFEDGSFLDWGTVRSDLEQVGTEGNDIIDRSAQTVDEIINGLGGNDTISAGSGNDLIILSSGNTTAQNSTGSDTFVFSAGSGTAVISETTSENLAGDFDTIIFGPGIYQSGTYFAADNDDLLITFRGSNDQITLVGELASSAEKVVTSFQFANGISLTLDEIVSSSFQPEAQDEFTYRAGTENDSFAFGLGDGHVTIIDGRVSSDGGKNDVLSFGSGISAEDLTLSSTGLDLTISIDGSDDAVTISNELLTGDLKRVGLFQFADSSQLTLNALFSSKTVAVSSTMDGDILERSLSFANEVIESTGDSVTIYAGSGNNTITDGNGDAIINAGAGHSIIDAGAGNNTIDLSAGGNATIVLGAGNDTIFDGNGSTVFEVNLGSGNSTIYERALATTPWDAEIHFGEGITIDDLSLVSHETDLTIKISKNGEEQFVTLDGGLSSAGDTHRQISQFVFADSSSMSLATFLAAQTITVVHSGNDAIEDRHFVAADEQIELQGDENRLLIGLGNDVINISGSNNVVFGGSGHEVFNITAGAQSNLIDIGGGATEINLAANTGHTIISNFTPAFFFGNTDSITLGSGISANDLTLVGSGNDVTIVANNQYHDQISFRNILNANQLKKISSFEFDGGTEYSLADLLSAGITFEEHDDYDFVGVSGWDFDKTVNSSGDFQTIYGGSAEDVINISGKDDFLYSGIGSAQINLSNDIGALEIFDTYVPTQASTTDTLAFGNEDTLASLVLSYNIANDILMSFSGSEDTVNLHEQLTGNAHKFIGEFQFEDGTITRNQLLQRDFVFTVTDDNITFFHSTSSFNEVITVNADNDAIFASSGNNTININGDNDSIVRNFADTTYLNAIVDGANTHINASKGTGTFTFADGMGDTVIDETLTRVYAPGNDHIIFAEGIDADNLELTYVNSTDLVIGFNDSSQNVKITHALDDQFKTVEDYTFSDGTVLSRDDLLQMEFFFTVNANNSSTQHFGNLRENITLNGANDVFLLAFGDTTVTVNGANDSIVQNASSTAELDVSVYGADAHVNAAKGIATFHLNAGIGNMVIDENLSKTFAPDDDHIVFGSGFESDDLLLTANNSNLIAGFSGSNDKVTINNALDGTHKSVADFAFADGTSLTLEQLLYEVGLTFDITASNTSVSHSAYNYKETINAYGDNDTIVLSNGNSTINAVGDDLTINAGTGNDTIIILGADSTINGSTGHYNFVLNQGMGTVDLFDVFAPTVAGTTDTVTFGAGITANNLQLSASSNNLVIGFASSSDQVTLYNQLASSPNKLIDSFVFADGTVLNHNQLLALGYTFNVTASNTTVDHSFFSYNETINVSGNNDVIRQSTGTSRVNASGNDTTIFANSGNDTISLSGHNATIHSGLGSGNFNLYTGMGTVLIDEFWGTSAPNDHIVFGSGINLEDLKLSSPNSADLVIAFYDSSDKITITHLVDGSRKTVADFTFADGTVLTKAQILAQGYTFDLTTNNTTLDHSFNSYNEIINVSGNNDTIRESTGTSKVNASGNDTTIYANSGNDTIVLSGHNATIHSGLGSGNFKVNSGMGTVLIDEFWGTSAPNDHMVFGAGIDLEDLKLSSPNSADLVIAFYNSADNITITHLVDGSRKTVADFTFADGTSLTKAQLLALGYTYDVSASNIAFSHSGQTYNETINVSGNNDTITESNGTSKVNISGNNTSINCGSGNDTINLSGNGLTANAGAGMDTFKLQAGMGTVVINETLGTSGTQNDHIKFGSGITLDNLKVYASGNDLLLAFYSSNDSIHITNELNVSKKQVADFSFSDNTLLSKQDLLARGLTYDIATDNTTLNHSGATVNEFIDVYGANDTVFAGTGQVRTTIFGDNATVHAGSGNETIVVYGEDAVLYGSSGQTDYQIHGGIDTATIYDVTAPGSSGAHNTVTFDSSFDADNIIVSVLNDDLLIGFSGSTDSVVLKQQFTTSPARLTDLVFADSTVISHEDLMNMGLTYIVEDDGVFLNHWASNSSETVNVLGDNAIVWSSTGTSIINVSGANAEIWANSGHSTINVSGTNSRLYGWTGFTEFQLHDGIGTASIYDNYAPAVDGVHNTVELDSSFDVDDLRVAYTGNDLIISFVGDSDQVILRNQLIDNPVRLTDLVFADTTLKSHADLLALARNIDVNSDNYFLDHWNSNQNETVNITGDNAVIWSSTGNSVINVAGDNAEVWGNIGNTTINVSGNNSRLFGWTGYTDFELKDGFGNATIYDSYAPAVAGTHNTVTLDSSFSVADLQVSYTGSDLVISFAGDSDHFTLKNQLSDNPARLTDLVFANGTTKSHADLLVLAHTFNVSADNYFLDHWASTQNETVNVSGDNAVIWSSSGNSTINVSGNDAEVWGNSGNTTINVSGNDSRLFGWTGYTNFALQDGFGFATIFDAYAPSVTGTHNTVSLDSTFEASDLQVSYTGNDLIVSFAGDSDHFVLKNQLTDSPQRITDLVFADSTTKSHADLLALARTVNVSADGFFLDHWSSSQNETVNVSSNNNLIYSSTGNSVVNVAGNNAEVWGNAGNTIINVTGSNSKLHGWTGYTNFALKDGFGLATIYDLYAPASAGVHNTVTLDSSFDLENLQVSYLGTDLIISFAGDSDQFILKNQLNDNPLRLTDLVFADATIKSHADLLDLARTSNVDADNVFLNHWDSTQNETVNLNGNNDVVWGSTGNSTINISGDSDEAWGNVGNTTINIEGTNARAYGWTGYTNFVIHEGIGTASIYDLYAPTISGTHDTVSFDSNFDADDLLLSYSGSDLVISFTGMSDKVVLKQQLTDSPVRQTDLVFADSTVISHAELLEQGFTFNIDENNFFLNHWTSAQDETVNVSGNSDVIWGSTGDSTFNVSGDSNQVWTNDGDDTVNVSGDNNLIYAWSDSGTVNLSGDGNTFYSQAGKFTINVDTEHGTESIYENYNKSVDNHDVLQFGASVTDTDISFFMNGNNLQIGYGDQSTDVVTVYNQGISGREVEKVSIGDGQFLTDSEINQVINDMASYAAQNGVSFTSLSDVQNNNAMMNIITTAWHAA